MRFQWFSIGKPYIGAEWRFWLNQAAFFTKHTKSLQRNFRFQKQNSGICFISSGNVLLTGTNLSELFFRLRKCRKYPKKTVFFQQTPSFRMVFHGFPCQNFIHCSRHAYWGAVWYLKNRHMVFKVYFW